MGFKWTGRKSAKCTYTHCVGGALLGGNDGSSWIEFERRKKKKSVAKNFNYYFGLAHKTHKTHNKGSPDAKFMPHKTWTFSKKNISKSTF